MAEQPDDPEVALLLELLDQAYNRRSWHGPNLRGSVRGMDAELAGWRPGAGRHCACELVLHAAYWKHAVRRRVTGLAAGPFPFPGSNWFPVREVTGEIWRIAVGLLGEEHRLLREAVISLPPSQLGQRRGKWTVRQLVTGAAAHDLYHAGQIQLLKRLREK